MAVNSKVVHLRLRNETILCLLDYFEKYNEGVTADTLGARLSRSINAIGLGFIQQGLTTDYGDAANVLHELGRRLDEIAPKVATPPQFQPTPVVKSDEDEPTLDLTVSEGESPRDKLRELIAEGVANVTEPSIELDPDVWAPDGEDLPDPSEFKIDVDKVKRLDVSDVLTHFPELFDPSDTGVGSKIKTGSEAKVLALQIAMAYLQPKFWKQPQCERLVGSILSDCEDYLQPSAGDG